MGRNTRASGSSIFFNFVIGKNSFKLDQKLEYKVFLTNEKIDKDPLVLVFLATPSKFHLSALAS